jgi:hypothetical protein
MNQNAEMLITAVKQKASGLVMMFEIAKQQHHLVQHTQKSKNFGRKGGWLVVDFLTYSNGDPTGYAKSQIVYFNIPS